MNVAAFLFSLAGAALSIFQPALLFVLRKLSVYDILTLGINNPDIIRACYFVLCVAVIGAGSGVLALMREELSVVGLGLCTAFYGWVIMSIQSEINAHPDMGILFNLAFSWKETVLLWGGFYLAAAICAFIDGVSGKDRK